MNKIKKNDEVVLLSGKDKDKRGKITRILPNSQKVVVGGMNLYKRHLKRKSEKEQSQIITIEKPLNMAKVMVVCPHCNRPTRVGFSVENEKKIRVCKKCKKTI
jgi:large subunit ribosomal protein L24